MDWLEVYETARDDGVAAAGYYNHNIRVDLSAGAVNVRIPIPGAELMDVRLWPEAELLSALAGRLQAVPQVRHVHREPEFQVQGFVSGTVVHDDHPRGVVVPAQVIDDVVALFAQAARVPLAALPPLAYGWPTGSDTPGFGAVLSDFTTSVYERFREPFASFYAEIGVPPDPCAPIRDLWPGLAERSLTLVHADIHRKNMILGRDGTTVFLDWELALWGDPVYDLAVHLHKMAYRADERLRLLVRWWNALDAVHTRGWRRDLASYLAHERVKSAVVDSVRYAQHIACDNLGADDENVLVNKVAFKLNAAYPYWGADRSIDVAAVRSAAAGWAMRHARRAR